MKKSYQILRILIGFAVCLDMLQSFCVLQNPAYSVGVMGKLCHNLFISAWGLGFMLSGRFLLADADTDCAFFYKKRALRLLPPLLLCSLISLISQIGFSISVTYAKDYFKRLFLGAMEESYWFVYALIGFYLAAPFLARMLLILSEKEKRALFMLLLAYFLFFSLGVWFSFKIAVSAYPFLNWCCYALLGYLADHIGLTKKGRRIGILLGAVCFLISCAELLLFEGRNWSIDRFCLTRAGICIGIFLLAGLFDKGQASPLLNRISHSVYIACLLMAPLLRMAEKIGQKAPATDRLQRLWEGQGIAAHGSGLVFAAFLYGFGLACGMLLDFLQQKVCAAVTQLISRERKEDGADE